MHTCKFKYQTLQLPRKLVLMFDLCIQKVEVFDRIPEKRVNILKGTSSRKKVKLK